LTVDSRVLPPGGARPKPPNAGKGRKKGVPNRVTREVREAVKAALDAQGDKLSTWFDEVAADDPGRALQLYGQLAEYVAPKLGRTEVTGKDGEPLRASFSIDLSEDK
jgi:hypothetical protein